MRVQIPRFAFEKFPGAKAELTTQMKSVGEAMAIGRTFQVTFAAWQVSFLHSAQQAWQAIMLGFQLRCSSPGARATCACSATRRCRTCPLLLQRQKHSGSQELYVLLSCLQLCLQEQPQRPCKACTLRCRAARRLSNDECEHQLCLVAQYSSAPCQSLPSACRSPSRRRCAAGDGPAGLVAAQALAADSDITGSPLSDRHNMSQESFQKALRSLETGLQGWSLPKRWRQRTPQELEYEMRVPNPGRMMVIKQVLLRS